jgi:hypothetical protein
MMKNWIRAISLLVLITFSFSAMPIRAFAEAEQTVIKMDPKTASKLLDDIKFYKETSDKLKTKAETLEQANTASDQEIQLLKKKSDQQTIDLGLSMKASASYKDLYVKTDEARLKCEEDKPSRMLWLGVGVIGTLVLGAIIAMAAKR